MKSVVLILAALCALPSFASAGQINVAAISCSKYENETLPASGTNGNPDSINTVMWLFGYAVAKSGEKIMYGDALSAFGFALDAQCKNNPNQTLTDALATVKPLDKNPMDLTVLYCDTFSRRHLDLMKSDRESADTIMMWLMGFSVGSTGGRVLDYGILRNFEAAFLTGCAAAPHRTVYDELVALKGTAPAIPAP